MDWITAAGHIFEGAYGKSKQFQKEDFVLRNEKLTAERDSIINRKQKRYDLELASYYKENEKKKSIDALNSEFKQLNKSGENVDTIAYANKYLSLTDKYWGNYSANERNKKANLLAQRIKTMENPFKYEMQSKDPDALDAAFNAEQAKVLSVWEKELAAAKDNNFLVNKVLGKDTKINENAIADALKAEEKVGNWITKKDEIVKDEDKDDKMNWSEVEAYQEPVPEKYSEKFSTKRKELKIKDIGKDSAALEFMLANDYLNTADGKYYKIDDKGAITGGKPEGRALMKTYLDTYNTILNNSDVKDYYAMDSEIGNISKNFNSKAIHDETQRIIMSRAINLDETGWFDGKDDIKHIAIVPVKIMDLENKIDGKSVNGQKVSGLYEEFLRTVVEDDGMKFPQMANLKDSQIVSTVQSDMNRNNSYYAGLFKDFIKDKDIYIKEEVKVEEGQDDGKLDNINTDGAADNTTEGTTKTTKKYPVQRMKNGDIGIVVNGQVYSIKDNKEYFASLNDNELNTVIGEATKFGYNTNQMAPRGPEKYLKDDKGQIIKRGKAQRPKINPEWQKIEDLNKSLTSVKPKKVTKKKLR